MIAKTDSAGNLAIAHWNEAPLLLSEQERYTTYPWLYEVAEFRQHPAERVLELGCGTGCDLLQFARHGAHAVGVDLTPEHARLARQRVGSAAQVCRGDIRELPFADATFDYVYSHGVLHHSDQPRRIVAEMLRVLRPGGRFNIHVYNLWSYFVPGLMLKHGRNWRSYIENSRAPVHIDLYTPSSLRKLFAPVPVLVRRYECRFGQWMGQYIGWYLVATGAKPVSSE